ncbi:hypothetical protein [Cucumibacter marinus]|uniref:hypothetical protein n=1 Tax=Cucumibacter marinus TaxID=1121252 RepID=UPI000420F768|nr:hypothetical protein [Cucumibacter marinus]
MRQILSFVLIFGLTMSAPFTAFAQSGSSDSIPTFNLLPETGLIVGDTVRVDSRFAEQNDIEVPTPFSFLVPTERLVDAVVEPAPRPGTAFVKVSFVTEQRGLIEDLQIVPLSLSMEGDRLENLAQSLGNDAFNMAVEGSEQSARAVVRSTKISGYPAVEVLGQYVDSEKGPMYLRIVGIPHPAKPSGVVAVQSVVASRLDVPTPDAFPLTRGGTALRHFAFLD